MRQIATGASFALLGILRHDSGRTFVRSCHSVGDSSIVINLLQLTEPSELLTLESLVGESRFLYMAVTVLIPHP